MPDESCRKCGGMLIDYCKCTQCNKTIKMICVSCGNRTAEQFHSLCTYKILTKNGMLQTKFNNSFLDAMA
ncbi:hypothetical protein NMT12_20140 [metagenome]